MSTLCLKCRRPMMCGQKVMHLSCCPRCPDCGQVLLPATQHTCPRAADDGDHA